MLRDEDLDGLADRLRDDLCRTLAELVRTPSENLPPRGAEAACQRRIAAWLRELDLTPDLYDLLEVPGLTAHPEFYPGRDYAGRPNVNARWKGTGGGRSLILTGHIDTVPADTPAPWKRDPFGAAVEDGRLYGRGAWDMKAGVAMNLAVLRGLRQAGVRLKGDLLFETVVDEEFGGVNGTLAARLRGYNADAAIVGEPSSLRVCAAQRGGRIAHILFSGAGGILSEDRPAARVIEALAYVLGRLSEFAQKRAARVAVPEYYRGSVEPFAVWVTNIATGKWGWSQPITVPERCRIELYWQAMPEESRDEIDREFLAWWREITEARPELFAKPPEVSFPMRWLPGCLTPADAPLIREFVETARAAGLETKVEGMDAPSDMYIFPRCFSTPAFMWGPKGGGAHQPDEYVELDSLFEAMRVLLHFVPRWCGAE